MNEAMSGQKLENNEEDFESIKVPTNLEEFDYELSALLSSLKNRLESNSYDLIIGIDSSGRLPMFAIDQALRSMHPDNQRHAVVHISSKRNMSEYDELLYKNDLEKKFAELPESTHVLVVDDTVGSGEALSRIVGFLKQKRCVVEVAVLCVSDQQAIDFTDDNYIEKSIQFTSAKVGAPIYYGLFGSISGIYNKHWYSGVKKPKRDAENMLDSQFGSRGIDFFLVRKVALDAVKKFLKI